MGIWSSLKREQKESVVLLSTGTFLEYFDLMLYVHMAVVLNDLFFPQEDPYTASILAATALCSTFVFRPIGALFFGWIGDCYGRKKTIVFTTMLMAVSCIVMANLPTYAQIGISAAWAITICRILQGMSSMGEVIGAQVYLTETIGIPARYPATGFLGVSDELGGLCALGIAFLVTSSYGLNWRFAFWAGAIIAIIGAIARTRLRETPEFLEMKRKWLREGIQQMNIECDPIGGAKFNATWKEPVNNKTLLSYFLISCGYPFCFYLAFIYFNPILKQSFGYSPEEIIKHNFFLSLTSVTFSVFLTYLSYRVHPLRISKAKGILGFFLMVGLPFLIPNLTSSTQLFFVQALILITSFDAMPSYAVFLFYFPLYRRVTYAGVLFSLSKALMYPISSFGLIYLGSYFGHFGLWIIALPVAFSFLYGINHFLEAERKRLKKIPKLKTLPV